jgi:hypothetical protein
MTERASLAGDAGGVALVPHRLDDIGRGSLDRERPRADPLADTTDDRARLSGENRLVDR